MATESLKNAIDGLLGPSAIFVGTGIFLLALFLGRRRLARPRAAGIFLALSLLVFGLSLGDSHFRSVALAPDNIAVAAMFYSLVFFTWLAGSQAVNNDARMERSEPPIEKARDRKVTTWPDLVSSEAICMVLVTVVLLAWSMLVPAPLEAPANPTLTPNPSKAPWYFLGLQELLFYTDARLAGVGVPLLIIFGLMAVPYLDSHEEGSGYYTISRRRTAYVTFQFCLWLLWLLPIVIGVFFRGPNWRFSWPYS